MPNDKSTLITDQYKAAASMAADANSYRGLQIHALCGLHNFLAELCRQHIPPGSPVLDLAAGSGAMCLRLKDISYQPYAVDYVPENFRPSDIPFVRANLNENFGDLFEGTVFGGIIASEIIEHLENPRHFVRQCRRLLS